MIFFYLLVSVMPLARHPLWSRFWGELTVVKYLGAACLAYAIFHLVTRRRMPPFFTTWQARLFILFYLIAAMSFFLKPAPSDWELSPFMTYTSFVVLYFVTLTVVDSTKRLRWVLLVAVGSVGFASLYVLREWQKYHDVYRNFRPGWVVGDPNYFTVSALASVPLAFYLMLESHSRWERLFCFGSLVTTLTAVTLGGSRGGFLGLMAAVFYAIWRSSRRARNLALATALLVPLSLFAPSSPLRRFMQPAHGDRSAEQSRIAVWSAGLKMIGAHPVQGVGLGNFKPVVTQYEDPTVDLEKVAHNSYIEIAAEMGVPALLIFLGILYFSFRTLGRTRRWALDCGDPVLHQAAVGLQAGLVGCSVAIFFVSGQYQKLLWLALFLSMSSPLLGARNAAKLNRDRKDPLTGVEPVLTGRRMFPIHTNR